jgi:hypothetical protein
VEQKLIRNIFAKENLQRIEKPNCKDFIRWAAPVGVFYPLKKIFAFFARNQLQSNYVRFSNKLKTEAPAGSHEKQFPQRIKL